MDGRSALLTLWGKETDIEVVTGELYIVQNIVPSNDFNKQRCYSSTPLTKFEVKWMYTISLQYLINCLGKINAFRQTNCLKIK